MRTQGESARVSHYLSDEDRESLHVIRTAIGNQGFSTIVHMALFRWAKELRQGYDLPGDDAVVAADEGEAVSEE